MNVEKRSGFTLIEMIVVISFILFLILSISTAAPYWLDRLSLSVSRTELVHDIQQHRDYARVHSQPVKFTFTLSAMPSYVIYHGDLASNTWIRVYTHESFFDQIEVLSTTLENHVLVFDHLGQPCETTDATAPLLSTATVTVANETITLGTEWIFSSLVIHPVSGLVEVE